MVPLGAATGGAGEARSCVGAETHSRARTPIRGFYAAPWRPASAAVVVAVSGFLARR
jgi:hypothetical protein